MAKFNIGEQAVFRRGPDVHNEFPLADKQVVTICAIREQDTVVIDHIRRERYLSGTYYKPEEATIWWVHESQLEKLLPKHQDSDLKAAEPHFINHQLPRWLKREEKESA